MPDSQLREPTFESPLLQFWNFGIFILSTTSQFFIKHIIKVPIVPDEKLMLANPAASGMLKIMMMVNVHILYTSKEPVGPPVE